MFDLKKVLTVIGEQVSCHRSVTEILPDNIDIQVFQAEGLFQ